MASVGLQRLEFGKALLQLLLGRLWPGRGEPVSGDAVQVLDPRCTVVAYNFKDFRLGFAILDGMAQHRAADQVALLDTVACVGG